jgi:hypothetical protein
MLTLCLLFVFGVVENILSDSFLSVFLKPLMDVKGTSTTYFACVLGLLMGYRPALGLFRVLACGCMPIRFGYPVELDQLYLLIVSRIDTRCRGLSGARWGTPTSSTVPLSFRQLGVFSDHRLHYFPFSV